VAQRDGELLVQMRSMAAACSFIWTVYRSSAREEAEDAQLDATDLLDSSAWTAVV
jgi:hypothetical protein